jgi:C4-type Zn-finger protein
MRCPDCGATMNHHAEKPIKTPFGDEVIADIYYCPACGKVEAKMERLSS